MNALSTTSSIARHESKIQSYTGYTTGSWNAKFNLAALKLGNDILSRIGVNSDLDDILNPLTLVLASDYLTLALSFTLLANQGLNLVFETKKLHYWRQYSYLLASSLTRLKFNNGSQLIVSGRLSL